MSNVSNNNSNNDIYNHYNFNKKKEPDPQLNTSFLSQAEIAYKIEVDRQNNLKYNQKIEEQILNNDNLKKQEDYIPPQKYFETNQNEWEKKTFNKPKISANHTELYIKIFCTISILIAIKIFFF